MVKHDEVHGKRVDAANRAAARMITRIGVAVEKMDKYISEGTEDDRYIIGCKFKVRYDDQGDVLLILYSRSIRGEEIGFQAAPTVCAAFVSAVNRIENGQFQWKAEVPYEQRKSNT